MDFASTLAAWSVDRSTVAVLAVILWLDGWRKAPDDAVVVRRTLLGRWRVHDVAARVGGHAFVAWWPPFVMPFVVGASTAGLGARWSFDVAVARAERRLRRLRWDTFIARVLSALLVLWIVLGIPMLTAMSGGVGLVRGIWTALLLATSVAIITTIALRRIGIPWQQAARQTAVLVSPFSTSRAPELLVAAALADAAPIVALRALLGDEAFRAWVRPWAFDALYSGGGAAIADNGSWLSHVVVAALPGALLERAVAAPSRASDDREQTEIEHYCARCGRIFRHTASSCTECSDVRLRPFSHVAG